MKNYEIDKMNVYFSYKIYFIIVLASLIYTYSENHGKNKKHTKAWFYLLTSQKQSKFMEQTVPEARMHANCGIQPLIKDEVIKKI